MVEENGTMAESPATDDEPVDVFPQQKQVADRLVEMARKTIGPEVYSQFSSIDFIIVSPRFTSLRAQTSSRLVTAGLSPSFHDANEKRVVPHDVSSSSWKEFHKRLQCDDNKDSLFVIIDDECHFGPTRKGAHDQIVNFTDSPEALDRPNLLVLQVSATPQNCLTDKSRIPDSENNVLSWSYQSESLIDLLGVDQCKTSIYRSLDWYCETVLWRLSSQRTIVFRPPGIAAAPIEVNLGERLQSFTFYSFDFVDFAKVTTEVFRMIPGLEKVKIVRWIQQGNPLLRIEFPAKNWEVGNNVFVSETLGFCLPSGDGFYQVDGKELSGKAVPRLCEPAEGGALPQVHQHIRSDESVRTMIQKRREAVKLPESAPTSTTEGSSTTTTPSSKRSKNEHPSIVQVEEHDSHLLVVDYIISMAYFAFFRLRENLQYGEPVLRDLPSNSFDDDKLITDDQVRNMLDALNIIQREKIKVQGSDNSVRGAQHVELKDFEATMKFVMNDFEDEAKETLGITDDPCQVTVWREILLAKLASERASSESNDRRSWFTESDRLIKTLLSAECIKGKDGMKGSMAFARVYTTDRSNLLQAHLRSAMRTLGLVHHLETAHGKSRQRPFFAVLSDNGDVKLKHEIVAENWADAKLGSEGDTVLDRFCENPQRASQGDEKKSLGYMILEDLPCLVLLCEKGRMGDTFPQSLQLIDVRARASGTYTCLIQEFGRACRYPSISKDWSLCMDNGVDKLEVRERLKARLKATGAVPIALFRPGPDMDAFRAPLEGTFLGQAEWEAQLETLVNRANIGDVFLQYRYALPSLLLSDDIASKIETAVKLRNQVALNRSLLNPSLSNEARGRLVSNLPRITACISMNLDQYVQKINPRKKLSIEDSVLHNQFYRKCLKPTEVHFDNAASRAHERRLLLFAECQIGKTGVFTSFLRKLKQDFSSGKDQPLFIEKVPEVLPAVESNVTDFLLPFWEHLYPFSQEQLDVEYTGPKEGQYHSIIERERRERLKEYRKGLHVYASMSRRGECILSHIGYRKLEILTSESSTPRNENQLLDWDGKLSKALGVNNEDSLERINAVGTAGVDKWARDLKTTTYSSQHRLSAKVVQEQKASDELGEVHVQRFRSSCVWDGSLEIQVSLFKGESMLDLKQMVESAKLPCVFVPSYRRPKHASVDYSSTMDPNRIVFVVCRGGEQFRMYRDSIGHKVRIIGMPSEFTFLYPERTLPSGAKVPAMRLPLSSSTHGIGFARLFIQLVARDFFRLNEIWMMDDNVKSCFDRLLSPKDVSQMRCRFEDVLVAVEKPLMGGKETKVDTPSSHPSVSRAIADLQAKVSNDSHGEVFPFPRTTVMRGKSLSRTVQEYCGHRNNYGVLGICRADRFGRSFLEGKKGFSQPTHSIYSMLLLNLKALQDKQLYFPAKPWLEDIEFMHCVHESGLAVTRFNRFFHTKNYPRPTDETLAKAFQSVAKNHSAKFGWRHFSIEGAQSCGEVDSWAREVEALYCIVTALPGTPMPQKLVAVISLGFVPCGEPPFARPVQWSHFLKSRIELHLSKFDLVVLMQPRTQQGGNDWVPELQSFQRWVNDEAIERLERTAESSPFLITSFWRPPKMPSGDASQPSRMDDVKEDTEVGHLPQNQSPQSVNQDQARASSKKRTPAATTNSGGSKKKRARDEVHGTPQSRSGPLTPERQSGGGADEEAKQGSTEKPNKHGLTKNSLIEVIRFGDLTGVVQTAGLDGLHLIRNGLCIKHKKFGVEWTISFKYNDDDARTEPGPVRITWKVEWPRDERVAMDNVLEVTESPEQAEVRWRAGKNGSAPVKRAGTIANQVMEKALLLRAEFLMKLSELVADPAEKEKALAAATKLKEAVPKTGPEFCGLRDPAVQVELAKERERQEKR